MQGNPSVGGVSVQFHLIFHWKTRVSFPGCLRKKRKKKKNRGEGKEAGEGQRF